MKQMIKVIRKADVERQYKEILVKEQDYELLCLADAMKNNDTQGIARSKKRLTEIHHELVSL